MISLNENQSNLFDAARFIAIEGPTGVGKTSLAQRLGATLDAQLFLENATSNAFLGRFYQNRERWALSAQIAFLYQRIDQCAEWPKPDNGKKLVSDFLIDKDMLFAEINLPEDELQLYKRLHVGLAPAATPKPDLVIYLQASPETLLARVHQRGTEAERPMSEAYLRKLAERYTAFFYEYDAAPLFTVDTSVLNPVDDDTDFAMLIERLRNMRSYREFFGYA